MQNKNYIEPALQIGGALILGLTAKKILEAFGLIQSGQDTKNQDAQMTQLKKELDQVLKYQALTRPVSDYYSFANTIWNALKYSDLDDDADAAELAFTSAINNYADLAMLKYVYGFRITSQFGWDQGAFDLITTLQREFSQSRKNDVMSILYKKGVTISL